MPDRKPMTGVKRRCSYGTGSKATGYVRVIPRKGGPVFYAKLKLPDGSQPQRRLGKVWTKRTRPPEGHLTRGMAEARLQAILDGDDPLVNVAPSHVTFGQACDEHLRYLEHDRQRKRVLPATTAGPSSRCYLLPALGESTAVEDDHDRATSTRSARNCSRARSRTRLFRRFWCCSAASLRRAKRKGWIAVEPVRRTPRRSPCGAATSSTCSTSNRSTRSPERPTNELLAALFIDRRVHRAAARRGARAALAARRLREPHPARQAQPRRWDGRGGHAEVASRPQRAPVRSSRRRARRAEPARSLHRPGRPRVRRPWSAGTCNDDDVRDGFYDALNPAELGHLRAKQDPIVFHDLGTRSGRSARQRGSTCVASRRGWDTPNIQTTMRYLHYVPQHDDAARLTAAFAAVSESEPREPSTAFAEGI